ncbi:MULTISPECIES: hypothetical protein [unclassified Polaribacter]|jgi:hypothetical protein|uniref:hypothetical protein n=1 Tax=unclassified Polaribacter TaxID=196858 RepID=UPI00052C11B8|nr:MULTISPECIES: hypothetical protein [unclassified Polaribacter]KGL60074.1 conserved hypothetical protein, quinonprotein alcohol dehydrogenase-like superfamily [Polaribacter sp. Hel1_33_49]MBT3740915.1 hypothetical protein [Polaribacter sp.]MDG1194784.1 hypothetical protein [Polaribacter sp.]MDG1403976.1 hypothetical protein [Polaribacter sp.]MDG2435495.1 hypothetical protein [Polaribacter sp.]
MIKYWPVLCLIVLFNCSKKEVFNITEITETTNEIDFIQTLGGSKNDALSSVKKTADGGYIVAGFTQSNDFDIDSKTNESFDFLVSKFSFDNTLEWQKTFGGSDDDRAADIVQTLDGGFAVLGYSKSSDINVSENAGAQDFWLLKISSLGSLLWEKTFGFSGTDFGTALLATKDGGFLITGVLDVSSSGGQGNAKSTAVNHSGGDYWVIKTDLTGNLEWSRFFGGSFTEIPLGIVETDDHNFIIAGSSDSDDFNISNNLGTYDFWIIKIAPTGSLIWEKSFGGSEIDEARAITTSSDGNFMVVGDTRSSDIDVSENKGAADVWIVKFSTEGSLIWEKTIGGTSFDTARAIYKTQDNGFLIAGSSRSLDNDFENNGQNDALILKIDSNGSLLWQKTIGGSQIDFLYGITELNNKAIIAVGESSSSDKDITENKGFTDALIIQMK